MLQFETTNRVLQEERLFEPTDEMREGANITQYMRAKGFDSYEDLHKWTIEHPEEFWAEMAKELHWFAPWDNVRDWQFPYVKWFTGAKTNIVYNCLDRHRGTPVWNQVAIYWEGENGETRSLSYADLWRETTKFSDVLTKLGIAEGDKTCIYMPKIPEQFVAMLGTTRIGAAHSVVFSGFSSQALRDRIQEGEAKIVICADGYQYRGKLVDLKAIVDAAVRECPTVEHVIVVKRAGNHVNWVQGRDLWYDDLMSIAKPGMPAAELDSETPLYYLYTSGSTGKPKGIVHTHGGYMVGTYTTTKFIFDIKPDDIFWDTADPGWVTGHSYIVYGPMLAGCTQVFYEGAVDFPNPGRIWKTIEKYGVTILYTAPTAIRALMRQGDQWPGSANLSSLRLLGSVGEPINPEAWMWYRKVTGDKHPIMDTWWQTETGAIMISPTPIMPLKPGSATKPFLGIEADVVDKQGNPVPEGEGGYLIIRQPWPSMMRTIYRDAERYEIVLADDRGRLLRGGFRLPRCGRLLLDSGARGRRDQEGGPPPRFVRDRERAGLASRCRGSRRHWQAGRCQGREHQGIRHPQDRPQRLGRADAGTDAARPRDRRPNRTAGRIRVRAQPAEDPQRQDHAPLHQGTGTRSADGRPLDTGGVTRR